MLQFISLDEGDLTKGQIENKNNNNNNNWMQLNINQRQIEYNLSLFPRLQGLNNSLISKFIIDNRMEKS